MLVSETHFTVNTVFRIRGYRVYSTEHPSNKARGGTAILIRESITHFEMDKFPQDYMQATSVNITMGSYQLAISSIYCPPRCTIISSQFSSFFATLGQCYIVGGDFNSKNKYWDSRLNTPKGRQLLEAVNLSNSTPISTGKPTYWPTDSNRQPDLLDFFVVKGVPSSQLHVDELVDLSSDHIPIVLTFASEPIYIQRPVGLTSKHTNWDLFREELDHRINLKVRLKEVVDIEETLKAFVSNICTAAKIATPDASPAISQKSAITYPLEVRIMVAKKRRARRRWQESRDPTDKATLNKLCKELREKIREVKNNSFQAYLGSLTPTETTDYSLWKAAKYLKRPVVQLPPLRNTNGTWARNDIQKATVFADHLVQVFQPNAIHSDENLEVSTQLDDDPPIRLVTPMEVAREITYGLKSKKAPGYDGISARILKELPRKGLILLTYIINAAFRLKYVPQSWKKAEVIMILKPGKPSDLAASYRPISLLPTLSKLFEKLLLRRLKPLLAKRQLIPNEQYGFRERHSTIDQVHRLTSEISKALEEKKYCCAAFLDSAQAFDRVWHEGLLFKLRCNLPPAYSDLLASYLKERLFRVKCGVTTTNWYPIAAGVPQGSVLGPLLYLVYTHDIPQHPNTTTALFADDTAILAIAKTQDLATSQLQSALDDVALWTRSWKIRLNPDKSTHVVFTLRNTDSIPLLLEEKIIPRKDSAKYLGMHLDSRLNWKVHVKLKRQQMRERMRSLYWLLGSHSSLSLNSKRLLYIATVKPIWTYGCQLWGCASSSNIDIIDRGQNIALRTIVHAYRYERNTDIQRDLRIPSVREEILRFASRYELRLHQHPNSTALELLDTGQDVRRLKRFKPFDLVSRFSIS